MNEIISYFLYGIMFGTLLFLINDKGVWLLTLLEKSWKYELFWKWYYRLVPIATILLWVLILLNPELFTDDVLDNF